MAKVLYIKANAKPEGVSRTFKVSDAFIDAYRTAHPNDEIVTLDLYKEGVVPLSAEDINEVFAPKNEESRKHSILKYAYQFAEADKYVVAAPMWNLNVPAIMLCYIDYVTVVGVTFKYTAEGAVGLLSGKKALFIASRGGEYTHPPHSDFEMGERYIRTIFGFYGIGDFTSIVADGLDIQGNDVDAIVNGAIEKAKAFAKTF